EVFDEANTVLAQKISQVEGVGQVFVGGGQQPAVRVQVDPAQLASMGLSMGDVRTALQTATANGPKGTIAAEGTTLTVTANDQLFTAEDFGKLVVATGPNGAVRLSQVARVLDDVENSRVAAWTDGQRSVLMIVRRQPGANILETNERVKAILPQLAAQISPAIDTQVALDRTQTIRASVREVEHTLLIGIALVVGVVFVFLRSVRATAIPSVAVPLSLIGTFGVMYLLDYSIDNLSLMALTISTGFVVDDAIVVTENVSRYLEKGMDPVEAALEGARQIGFTIVSITVSLLAVFLPILLMGGVIGRLFREFAVVLAVAIAVSAVLSLTLTPMMCAKLLRADTGNHGRLYQLSERGFEWLVNTYARMLDWVLDHRKLMLAVMAATIAATVGLFIVIPKGLFPQQDNGLLFGITEAPQDVSFASMKERQERLNALLKTEKEIDHFVVFIGSGGGGSSSNTGTVFMALRTVPPREVAADAVVARLRPQVAKLGGLNMFVQAAQDIRVGGRSARTQYQYTLQSSDLTELRTWAPRAFEAMRKLPTLKDVATDQQNAGLQLDVTIDRDRASSLNISARAVDDALYDSFGQRQVATTFTNLNQYRVVLETTPELQHGEDSLDRLFVKSDTGALVPLGAIARRSISSAPLAINHQGQFPSVTISFNLAEGTSLGQAMEAVRSAELSIGLPPTVQATYSGTAQAFQDSLRTQPLLLLAALVTVYIVLGILYESFIHPITILSTLPSAGLGALIALWLMKTEFSLIALIGIILLIGIVKKNAIMVVDFALETERDEGLSTLESIRKACVLRFRPILMTTVAALLGGLPLALGTGPGAELRRPLGITI
ncbi:MAG: acriflavine resistance protein B, partial [Myxococcales bacterium]